MITDRNLARDVHAILPREAPGTEPLPPPPDKPEVGPVSSVAGPTPLPAAQAVTGGIASPLVELDPGLREYHAPRLRYSSDGLFAFEVEPLAKVVMQDANGAEVVLEFADPDAE